MPRHLLVPLLCLPLALAVPHPARGTGPPVARTRTDRYGDPLPAGAFARLGTVRWRHPSQVFSVAYSPDGRLVATLSVGQSIHLWQASTGKELFRFPAAASPWGPMVAFSPDGKLLAAACGRGEGAIRLWDVRTGKERVRLGAAGCVPGAVAFSPDGKVVASVDLSTRTTRLWRVATGKEVAGFKGPGGASVAVAFAPDGKALAVAREEEVCLCDAETGRKLRTLRRHKRGFVLLAFAPDGTLASAVAQEKVIRLWDAATGREKRVLRAGKGAINALAFSADGKELVAGGAQDGSFRVWDPATGKLVLAHQGLPAVGCGCLALSPDGKTVAEGSINFIHQLRFWDVRTGKEVAPQQGHGVAVGFVAFAPGDKVVTSGAGAYFRSSVRVWDKVSGKQLARLGEGGTILFARAALSPDGRTVAAGQLDDTAVTLWDLTTGKKRTLSGGTGRVSGLCFSPDGKALVVGDCQITKGYVCTATFWDVATGKRARQFALPGSRLDGLAFSPDGGTLASVGSGVRLWDAATGRALAGLAPPGRGSSVQGTACFSPDGSLLAVAGYPKGFYVWQVPARRLVGCFAGKGGPGRSVAFSPDGRLLACGKEDGSVELWEVLTWTPAGRRQGPRGRVYGVGFSADGRTLGSGHEDTTVLLWDVPGVWAPAGSPGPLTAARLGELWARLGSEDAGEALRAAAVLSRAPGLLRERLRAVPPPERPVARWLADLDSEDFAAREKASAELAKLGPPAAPALRRALEGRPSPEVRKRVERLLRRIGEQRRTPAQLRELRGVAVLEWAGTGEAKALLRRLAGGFADAPLTREAKAALRRLESHPGR